VASPTEERRVEVLKLYFESFKHVTTLDTATALVLLAVYRFSDTRPATLGLTLALLGLSLVTCILGMASVITVVGADTRRPTTPQPYLTGSTARQ